MNCTWLQKLQVDLQHNLSVPLFQILNLFLMHAAHASLYIDVCTQILLINNANNELFIHSINAVYFCK